MFLKKLCRSHNFEHFDLNHKLHCLWFLYIYIFLIFGYLQELNVERFIMSNQKL
jgi:hypothetical protein